MENKTPDAADVAPRPAQKKQAPQPDGRKNAATGDKPTDQGRTIPTKDLNSANDD